MSLNTKLRTVLFLILTFNIWASVESAGIYKSISCIDSKDIVGIINSHVQKTRGWAKDEYYIELSRNNDSYKDSNVMIYDVVFKSDEEEFLRQLKSGESVRIGGSENSFAIYFDCMTKEIKEYRYQ